MSNAKTYKGGCHCGAVRYEATTALDRVVTCNCSLCEKKGLLLAFVPAEQFTLFSDNNAQTIYQFARKRIDHLFCSTCGVQSFFKGSTTDGHPMYAVNVRCLEGVEVSHLSLTPFDGKNL